MIDIQNQWALQIDVTNVCNRACSNCTRFVGHHRKPYFMDLDAFESAVEALRDFPTDSPPFQHPTHRVANKVVGIIGGEPLMHPRFEQLASAMAAVIPDRRHRGLWTGLPWRRTKHAELIEDVFGYVNNNTHSTKVLHSPVLVAIKDVIPNPVERWKLIDGCWLQRTWSGAITPKGLFFCEVAAAMDMLFDGPGGLPVEPGCWRRPLKDFQEQIRTWCDRCGVPLNLEGRLDRENRDDVSPSNLKQLQDSPRIQAGDFVPFVQIEKTAEPWRYMR